MHAIVIRLVYVGALSGLLAGMAVAMPADPTRPLEAQSCSVAQARLTEARMGSPLLSADERAHVLRVALADVARLCDAEQRDGALQAPGTPTDAQTPDAERVTPGRSRALHPSMFFHPGAAHSLR